MKTIFCLMFMFYAPSLIFGQNNCINEISTNPEDAFNNVLPATDDYPNGDPRFINTFDWYRNSNIPLHNFLPVYPTDMTKLDFDSHSYYTFLSSREDLTPENGWELMLFNTGYYPDQSEVTGLGTQDLPYIVIYNRFTGILRVFGSYGVSPVVNGGMSFDGLRITVKFSDPDFLSGNLRLRNGHDAPLDQSTDVLLTQAMALHTNSPSQWFCTDFQLAYDPCVCYYPSQLRLYFDFYDSKEITLYGRSITVQDQIADGNHLLTNNFLSNFQNTVVDAQGNFTTDDQVIMYKVMSDFVDDYINKLEAYKNELAQVQEYNKEVERKLVIVKIFKDVVINGATYGVSSFIGQNWFQNAIDFADDFIPPLNADSESIAGYRKKLEAAAKKAIGSRVEMFIDKNLKKKKEPTKPDAPVANFTETKMTGKLTDLISVEKPAFYTPGSYGSDGTGSPVLNNPLAYPIYNNAVGTFALLNGPKIKAYKSPRVTFGEYHEDYEVPTSNPNTPPLERYRGYESWGGNYQFQLGNDIYYAINDINIKSHSVRVSIEVEGNPKKNTSIQSNLFLDPTKVNNFTSEQIETNEFYPIKVDNGLGYNNGDNYCNYLFSSSTCTYQQNNLANTNYNKDIVIFSSEYFSIDAISPIVFSFGIVNDLSYQAAILPNFIDPENDGYRFDNIKVKLKLIVDVVYEDLDENDENITETLMFTYDVDDLEWVTTPLEVNIQNSPTNYNEYEPNLILNSTNFDGSPVEGCKLVGTHYTCHGWDDVTVIGDLTTSGGHTVDIFGANNVFVVGESNVSPEIVLDIKSLLNYSDPMPRADDGFVKDFCKNNLSAGFPFYEANRPGKKAREEYEYFTTSSSLNDLTKEAILEVTFFPVPAQNNMTIKSSMILSNETFVLMDLSGRILNCPVKKTGTDTYDLDLSKIVDGAYYLSIRSNEGEANKLFNILRNN